MADQAQTDAGDSFSREMDSFSDEVLVERLYDLAAQLISGKAREDGDELARNEAVVFRRLERAYSKDPRDSPHSPHMDS
ncbi:MAG: hypothetical protein M3Q11_06095 [Pseudomonadota bacterium]|nr:hypothetical protein [Pseudomonadota bacterium]